MSLKKKIIESITKGKKLNECGGGFVGGWSSACGDGFKVVPWKKTIKKVKKETIKTRTKKSNAKSICKIAYSSALALQCYLDELLEKLSNENITLNSNVMRSLTKLLNSCNTFIDAIDNEVKKNN